MSSGIGYHYGDFIDSDEWVLSDLLEDQGYDYPQAYVDAFAISVQSVIEALPITLSHISSDED